MNNEEIYENNEEKDLNATLQIRLTHTEKISAARACNKIDLTLSQVCRALLAQFAKNFNDGAIEGFKLEQAAMSSVLNTLTKKRGMKL
jgi:hypothetical protein